MLTSAFLFTSILLGQSLPPAPNPFNSRPPTWATGYNTQRAAPVIVVQPSPYERFYPSFTSPDDSPAARGIGEAMDDIFRQRRQAEERRQAPVGSAICTTNYGQTICSQK